MLIEKYNLIIFREEIVLFQVMPVSARYAKIVDYVSFFSAFLKKILKMI